MIASSGAAHDVRVRVPHAGRVGGHHPVRQPGTTELRMVEAAEAATTSDGWSRARANSSRGEDLGSKEHEPIADALARTCSRAEFSSWRRIE